MTIGRRAEQEGGGGTGAFDRQERGYLTMVCSVPAPRHPRRAAPLDPLARAFHPCEPSTCTPREPGKCRRRVSTTKSPPSPSPFNPVPQIQRVPHEKQRMGTLTRYWRSSATSESRACVAASKPGRGSARKAMFFCAVVTWYAGFEPYRLNQNTRASADFLWFPLADSYFLLHMFVPSPGLMPFPEAAAVADPILASKFPHECWLAALDLANVGVFPPTCCFASRQTWAQAR